MIDSTQTQAFLKMLGHPPFVFQTFTDNKKIRKKQRRDPLARVLVGTFEDHEQQLGRLSSKGAGIFVQINAAEERGKDNVSAIRSLFLDLDRPDTLKESLKLLQSAMPRPTAVVESSPGKMHMYWTVADCPVGKFKVLQTSLAVTFGGDLQVSNLDRVMRLPGFPHQKEEPVPVAFTDFGGVHNVVDLVKKAKAAQPMNLASAGVSAAKSANQTHNAFGLDTAHEVPTVLPPGERTHKLVSHAGYLISQGFSEEYVRAELIRMNVELCPEGSEPIPPDQLEMEVLGAVSKFADVRTAESPHTPAPPAPPPQAEASPIAPALLTEAVPPSQAEAVPPSQAEAVPPQAEASPIAPALLPDADAVDDVIKALLPDSNTEEHTLDAWVDRFLFVESESQIVDRTRHGTHAVFTLTDFKNKYANVFVGAKSKLCNQWIQCTNRQDVRAMVYVPTQDKIISERGVKMWNTYESSDVTPAESCSLDDIKPFIAHMNALFPLPADRAIFLDWMAMTITKPEIRIPWAPLLVSPQGAGKGLIYRIMAKMMGGHNCNMILPERLDSQFNGFIANSTLVCVDEMASKDKRGVANKLKNLITEDHIEVNIKNKKEATTAVYANILFFSNKMDAAFIEQEDRRFWVYEIADVPDTAHFDVIWEWIRDPVNIGLLLRWFKDRNLQGFKYARAPEMTEAKLAMMDAGKSRIETIIADAIDHNEGPFKADVISYLIVESFVLNELNETQLGNYKYEMKSVWDRMFKPLSRKLSYATVSIGEKHRTRVRCIRNFSHWNKQTGRALGQEATRAAQMWLTPTDVNPPNFEVVK